MVFYHNSRNLTIAWKQTIHKVEKFTGGKGNDAFYMTLGNWEPSEPEQTCSIVFPRALFFPLPVRLAHLIPSCKPYLPQHSPTLLLYPQYSFNSSFHWNTTSHPSPISCHAEFYRTQFLYTLGFPHHLQFSHTDPGLTDISRYLLRVWERPGLKQRWVKSRPILYCPMTHLFACFRYLEILLCVNLIK